MHESDLERGLKNIDRDRALDALDAFLGESQAQLISSEDRTDLLSTDTVDEEFAALRLFATEAARRAFPIVLQSIKNIKEGEDPDDITINSFANIIVDSLVFHAKSETLKSLTDVVSE